MKFAFKLWEIALSKLFRMFIFLWWSAIVSLALRDRITKTRADYHVGKDMCIRVDGQMNADVYKTNENKEMPTCLLTRTHCGCLWEMQIKLRFNRRTSSGLPAWVLVYLKPSSPCHIWMSVCKSTYLAFMWAEQKYAHKPCIQPAFSSVGSVGRQFIFCCRSLLRHMQQELNSENWGRSQACNEAHIRCARDSRMRFIKSVSLSSQLVSQLMLKIIEQKQIQIRSTSMSTATFIFLSCLIF